jgi:hypothetical protein
MTHGRPSKPVPKPKPQKKKFLDKAENADTKPENSRHKEDFERLLDDAVEARKKK